jgi:hypothetical protein
MKQKIEIAAFLAICIMVISFAIKAGRHHEKCQDCKPSFGKDETEMVKFAEVCK